MRILGDYSQLITEANAEHERGIITPEGALLYVKISGFGERAAAFLIDYVLASCIPDLINMTILFSGSTAFFPTLVFFINFVFSTVFCLVYFLYFEVVWGGVTPGKKALGLQVIGRLGEPLSIPSVIIRNFVRYIELLLPLKILTITYFNLHSNAVLLPALLWLGCFSIVPLTNKERMRCGDLIASTWVIRSSAYNLGKKIASSQWKFSFTAKQLSIYGEKELLKLEEILRTGDSSELSTQRFREKLVDVIKERIGYVGSIKPAEYNRFINDFYSQQRRHLEEMKLSKGKSRKNQFDIHS